MHVVVIDGQGGGIGRLLVQKLKERLPAITVTAVGTNTIATSAMLKAGADQGATGENAVKVNAAQADIILGPVGIVVSDSLLGEITPIMAHAVGASPALRILIPMEKCSTLVAGACGMSLSALVADAVDRVAAYEQSKG